MRTITNRKKLCITLMFIFLCSGFQIFSQTEKYSGFNVSVHLENFFPQEDIVKDIYGDNAFPLNLQIGYKINRGLTIFTGIRYVSLSGETQTNIELNNISSQGITLSIISIPLGFNYHLTHKKICPYVGAGVMFNMYKESWETDGFEFKDSKFGFFLQGGIHYKISGKIRIFLQGQFISLETKMGNPIDPDINLGGYSAGIGLTYIF